MFPKQVLAKNLIVFQIVKQKKVESFLIKKCKNNKTMLVILVMQVILVTKFLNYFNLELQYKDTACVIRNKLINLLTEL